MKPGNGPMKGNVKIELPLSSSAPTRRTQGLLEGTFRCPLLSDEEDCAGAEGERFGRARPKSGTDIEEGPDRMVVVHVAGPNRRQVPVLASWAAEVAGLGRLAGRQPMFRADRTEIKRNDIARFCDRLVWRDAPRLSVNRLRATWIVEHLEAGTPLHVLAAAAGVRASSLARYATYARPIAVSAAERLLTLRRDRQ
jgi:hypothetical protein